MDNTPNRGYSVPSNDDTDLMDSDLWRIPISQIDTDIDGIDDKLKEQVYNAPVVLNTAQLGATASTGWSLQSATAVIRAGVASVRFEATRTGAAIVGNADGNIANIGVAAFTNVKIHPALGFAPLTTAHAGVIHGSYIGDNGVIALAALAPNANIGTNESIVFFGTYVVQDAI